MAQRRGIASAQAAREARRRREAREGGVILERPSASAAAAQKKKKTSRRERAVDAPDVGRLRGAELRLSRRDVRAIEGPRKADGKKKKKKRR